MTELKGDHRDGDNTFGRWHMSADGRGANGPPTRANLMLRLRRALLKPLCDGSWSQIEDTHRNVGLPWRADLEPGWGKSKYVEKALAAVADDELLSIADRVLESLPCDASLNVAHALDWVRADGVARLSEVTRLSLASALDGHRLAAWATPTEVLARFAVSETGQRFTYADDDSVIRIEPDFASFFAGEPGEGKGAHSNHLEVLDAFGFRGWPDRRLFELLEYLVHPTVRQGDEQAALVELLNSVLRQDRFELVAAGDMSGRPLFAVKPVQRGVLGKPKNLIFASTGPKPEIGFSDAVNNDIVLLTNTEHCLVYDEPLSTDGLLWTQLVSWWAKRDGSQPAEIATRKKLGERLLSSLASEPERLFFSAYFGVFKARLGEDLPALVPQVYLHYDPVSLRQLRARGDGRRFDVQRMDFLMLLPLGVRVVLEIDGQQHHSTGRELSARPSPEEYARTVRSDRQLRLAGYEVYRFGGFELRDETAGAAIVDEFFSSLFLRHNVRRKK
jgi:hypothetical protein